jgi:protein-S-isoprenylcysteine O-methyltransferase Ste14
MGIQLVPFHALLFTGGLLILAKIIFSKVRSDYVTRGALSKPVAIIQTSYFFVYAFSSYLFLDSRLNAIRPRGLVLVFIVLLMLIGLLIVLFSMPILGRRSFGSTIGQLHTTGLYHFSRNPQLMGSFIFIIGYCSLWPTWAGFLWAFLWLPISYWMVKAEEEHLLIVFGREYEIYRKNTSFFFNLPKRKS